jgi:hypothetical protein
MWWMLAGCDGGEPPPPDTTWSFRSVVLPEGPGDVIVLDLEQQEPTALLQNVEPLVVDGAGDRVPLVERTYLGFSYGWAPERGFVPGDYELRGAADYPVTRADRFVVSPFGEDALDGSALVGRSWALVDGRTAPTDLGPVGLAQGTVAVVVEALDGDAMTFALVYRSATDGDCVALRDTGAFDEERGGLRWEVDDDELVVPTTEGDVTLPIRDLWLEVEWLADQPTRALGQAAGTVETRALSEVADPEGGPDWACELLSAFGLPCVACTDELATCASVQVVKGSLQEVTPSLDPSALPLCGVDRVTVPVPVPSFTLQCDAVDLELSPVECGCASAGRVAGVPLALAALLALARRRRST